jgi:hypothetical protein
MGNTASKHSPKDTVGKQVHLADCVDEDRWMYRRYECYVLAYFLAVFFAGRGANSKPILPSVISSVR